MVRIGRRWLGLGRALVLAIIVVVGCLVLVLRAGITQGPSLPAAFAPGSIAFVRDGDFFLAASDGSAPVRVAQGHQPNGDGIGRFAFSPDRRYLAFGMPNGSGGETLGLLAADGTTTGIYTWGGHPPAPRSSAG